MRILETEEISRLRHVFDEAVNQAKLSPCQKSKRGAVVFKDGLILGRGFNAPPEPFSCDGVFCRPICSQFAIHAEQNAIYDALLRQNTVKDASIFHIKVKDGKSQISNDLSCAECSKLVLRLKLHEFILFQDQGFVAYEALEFHELTLAYLKAKQ